MEKDFEKMLVILRDIEKKEKYKEDKALIKTIIKKINDIVIDDNNATYEVLDWLEEKITYLDIKYVDLDCLTILYVPTMNMYKKRNHARYVEKIREENRKKRNDL